MPTNQATSFDYHHKSEQFGAQEAAIGYAKQGKLHSTGRQEPWLHATQLATNGPGDGELDERAAGSS